ncbi:MAG: efflux RND transporter permease subunit, partial [Gammaproteobacteria bacterium]|nr:efflux RND transporter permease subunit [Gammaproteobacteria bacterium]
TDVDMAQVMTKNRVAIAEPLLPQEVKRQGVLVDKQSTAMVEVVSLRSPGGTYDELYLSNYIATRIKDQLTRVQGVGTVTVFGAKDFSMRIWLDPQQLKARGVTANQVMSAVRAQNVAVAAGKIGGPPNPGNLPFQYNIITKGRLITEKEFGSIVIKAGDSGDLLYLRDVARVELASKDSSWYAQHSGSPAIALGIYQLPGSNALGVAQGVADIMDELAEDFPPDLEYDILYNATEYITASIDEVIQTLIVAIFLVILVVWVFLQDWRATLIPTVTIPVSLIGTFAVLLGLGMSINNLTLFGIILVIGIVVDDAIVVLENITKHVERGARPREAAIYATNEVWLAVIVTTLTVVAVFLPLTLIGGMTGELFRPLGYIVTITVVTSTVSAISLTPMLASKMMKLRKKPKKVRLISYDNIIGRFLNWLDGFYGRTLKLALRFRWGTLIIALVIFLLSMMMAGSMGFQFMPEADQGSMTAAIELQTGLRVDETTKVARKIDAYIEENMPEAQFYYTSSGSDDQGGIMSLFMESGSHRINIQFTLKDQETRGRDVWDLSNSLTEYLETIPEIITFDVVPNGGMGGTTENNVVVEIYGYDFEATSMIAHALADSVSTIQGATNVNVSRDPSKPELQIVPDREKMAQHGLNTFTLANSVRNRVEGPYMSRYREEGDEYAIVVRFIEEERSSLSDLEDIALMNMQNQVIRLGEVASIEENWSPPNIERKNRERMVTVSITPYKVPLNKMAEEVQNKINHMDIPSDVNVQMSGAVEDMQESMMDLFLLLVLSLVLTYLVMASQFESLRMPFIIMFSIPFAFTGVVLAHMVTGTTMSVISMVGGVMLIGIVVKNAIVLVDYINLMRERGLELKEAIVVSGKSRLRPVLMTSLTTILAMLPLAMSTGSGSEIWSPMGIAVIGGLIFSTIVTLVLVPVIYHMMLRRSDKRKKSVEFDFLNGHGEELPENP